MMRIVKKLNEGQSALEILIAIGILAIGLGAAMTAIFGGQSLSVDTQEATQAVNLARENLETTQASAESNFNGLSNSSSTQGEFLKEIIVQNIDANTKQVTSRVSWRTDPLRTQKIELNTLVTDWQQVQASGGDTGGSPPSGNWVSPQTLGSVNLGPGEQATELDALNKIVYMSAVASDNSKPDFFIVDATNGQSPVIVSSLDTGAGLNGVDVAGHYVYAVGLDSSQQLKIIDVSNINNPVKVAGLALPGSSAGLTIFYWNGLVYIGRAKGAPQEFEIVDVSDPLNPKLISGLSNVGGEINDIYVYDNRAYLGTEDSSRGMIVIDVSNPYSPSVLGSLNIGTHAYGIFVQSESKVLVGGKTSFYVADASNPANILTLGSVSIGYRTRDITASGQYGFLATEDTNREFITVDISNPQQPAIISSFNFPNIATGIDYENNLVYVSVRSNDGLRIITSGP